MKQETEKNKTKKKNKRNFGHLTKVFKAIKKKRVVEGGVQIEELKNRQR